MPFIDSLQGQTDRFVGAFLEWLVQAVPNLIAAFLILVIGLFVAAWAGRTARRFVQRDERIDPTFSTVAGSLVRYAVTIVVLIAALGQLGFQTTSLLAALGAAGLAIGLALQNTLSNIAAGFMLLWLHPFRKGDVIETSGTSGTVVDVGLFATELKTWDGIYKFVPNAELWNTKITNYSRYDNRMVELTFGIGYDDNVATARTVLLNMAESDERTHQEPARPIVFVEQLADSAVVLALRVWTSTDAYWSVRRDLSERGKQALEDAGLSIPFPQVDVHLPTQSPPTGDVA
ncbi:MAG: mechanosensitive ion channel family protein [Pseudomonadota bacterium]